MHKINKIFVSFECSDKDYENKEDYVSWSVESLIESGTPVCSACDGDMSLTSHYAEIEK